MSSRFSGFERSRAEVGRVVAPLLGPRRDLEVDRQPAPRPPRSPRGGVDLDVGAPPDRNPVCGQARGEGGVLEGASGSRPPTAR